MRIDCFGIFFLMFSLSGCPFCNAEANLNGLLARGEHRIEVQNFGSKNPEIPISIMQANYYNAHHPDYVIRIEDLNQTLNREINQDVDREYNDWFDAEFNRRLSEYYDAHNTGNLQDIAPIDEDQSEEY